MRWRWRAPTRPAIRRRAARPPWSATCGGAADRLAEADWDVLEGPVGAIVQAAVAREVAAAGEAYPPPARVAYVTSLAALEQARERLRAGQGQDGADAAAGGAPETGG